MSIDLQAGQSNHSGCFKGRILSASSYSPFRRVRWEQGRVSRQESLANMDPLVALEKCSPRFLTASPYPTIAPIKPSWYPEEARKQNKRPRTAGSSVSSPLPQDVQDEVMQLIGTAMHKHGFKLESEVACSQPQFSSIKQQQSGILAAGNFFCKLAGSYHTTSTSFFLLWPNGQLTQKCHNTQCSGKKASCGVWQLPPATARLLGVETKSE